MFLSNKETMVEAMSIMQNIRIYISYNMYLAAVLLEYSNKGTLKYGCNLLLFLQHSSFVIASAITNSLKPY